MVKTGSAKRHNNAWKHWCPNECGRQAVYDGSLKRYICSVCKGEFLKEDLK